MRRAMLAFAPGACAALLLAAGALAADSPPQPAGRQLFEEKCGMCHREGGMGTGLLSRRYTGGQELLERRENLDPAFIATAVRGGIGNMPRMPRGEVSDDELSLIARYLAGQEGS